MDSLVSVGDQAITQISRLNAKYVHSTNWTKSAIEYNLERLNFFEPDAKLICFQKDCQESGNIFGFTFVSNNVSNFIDVAGYLGSTDCSDNSLLLQNALRILQQILKPTSQINIRMNGDIAFELASTLKIQKYNVRSIEKFDGKFPIGIRKSYKNLINRGMRLADTNVFYGSIPDALIEEYAKFHEKSAGRKVRSLDTFRRQFAPVFNREGVYFRSAIEGKFGVGILCYLSDRNADYHASVRDKENHTDGVGHSTLLEAIRWIFSMTSCNQFVIEDEISELRDEKQLSIRKFKSGFGGELREHISIKGI